MITKQGKMSSLVSTMMTEVVPSVRKHMNTLVTVTEIIPPLIEAIQPTLRPVSYQWGSSFGSQNNQCKRGCWAIGKQDPYRL